MKDFPEFKPNLTPRQMFKMGSFGGTYWRPIRSKFFKGILRNAHHKYPKSWWKGIPEKHMVLPFNKYDKSINKYGVKVGTTLEFWESKNWIRPNNPYGWVQWYCDFHNGQRSYDDKRQVRRWLALAGPRGRFRRMLISLIDKKGTGIQSWNDPTISPAIRQTLQHWGYKLTKEDYLKGSKKYGN
tara:strand:- start:3377 stop:3928 length:552 start_codon:yes stop_codon:yes gene_type:complete